MAMATESMEFGMENDYVEDESMVLPWEDEAMATDSPSNGDEKQRQCGCSYIQIDHEKQSTISTEFMVPKVRMAMATSPSGQGKREIQINHVKQSTISTEFMGPKVRMAMATSPTGQGKREIQIDHVKPSSVSIFRVPNFLKQSKKGGAYVPKVVSLSPYYHRNAKLLAMEKHKEKALRRMETRFSIKHNDNSNSTDFSSCAKDVILNLNGEIRRSYEEEIRCEEEELAMMLCKDGCFVLEILRTLDGDVELPVEGYEPIFERNRIDYTGFDILNDILKLENQVPLIVLKKLLQLELSPNHEVEGNLFKWLVESPRYKFYPFDYIRRSKLQLEAPHLLGLLHGLIVSTPFDPPVQQEDRHLLGWLHRLIVSSAACLHVGRGKPKDVMKAVKRIPRAGKLKNAGIKFEARDAGIRKIRFERETGTIFLPHIYVTDHTEVLFRNLIAFELCKASDEPNYVTCYASLMDELIDMEEDVGVLIESEILTNYLGSDAEVVKLFNALCNGVTMSRIDAFKQLKEDVHHQYISKFKVWSAELIKNYFSSPWTVLALIGAVLALLLTLLQTIFSIIGVYK